MSDVTTNESKLVLSGPVNEIATAIAKAQLEMKNPKWDSTNPHFKNQYASLAAVRDAVVPVFAKYGVAIMQDVTTENGLVKCTTHLMHSSGQSTVFGPLTLPVSKADAQGYGSAITYARRYSLQAVANVVGDSDDDGNAAVDRTQERAANAQRAVVPKSEPAKKATKKAQLKAALEAWSVPSDEIHAAVLSIREHLEKSGVAKIGEAGDKGFSEDQCAKMLDWVDASQKEGLSFEDAMK